MTSKISVISFTFLIILTLLSACGGDKFTQSDYSAQDYISESVSSDASSDIVSDIEQSEDTFEQSNGSEPDAESEPNAESKPDTESEPDVQSEPDISVEPKPLPHTHVFDTHKSLDMFSHEGRCACGEVLVNKHNWVESAILKYPTYYEKGKSKYTCKDCNAEKTEDTNKLYTSAGLHFELNEDNDTYTVVGIGNCKDVLITIPVTFNGKPVTKIASRAFENQNQIRTVTMPSITEVGSYAFIGCKNITTLKMPAVSVIGVSAFGECAKLTSLSMPDKVMIGRYAFSGCVRLGKVATPSGVKNFIRSFDLSDPNKFINDVSGVKYDLDEIISAFSTKLECNGTPEVVIFHTHTVESFANGNTDTSKDSFNTNDSTKNVIAVGEEFANVLKEHGIGVIHDTTYYCNIDINNAYKLSRKGIEEHIAQHDSIKFVIDIHRDAVGTNSYCKTLYNSSSVEAAQVMLVVCSKNEGWKNDLAASALFQTEMNNMFPTLARPIYFTKGNISTEKITPADLLLEIGAAGNTLSEAKEAARLAAEAFCKAFT